MGKTATGAGTQKAYSTRGLSAAARLRFKTQRKKDHQATLDGRSYDDATMVGAVTMPLRAESPSGTNNHNNDNSSLIRVDPSNNFPCYITPDEHTLNMASGEKELIFNSDQQKIANDMLPLLNITGHQNIANVQSGLKVSMESYGPFSLNSLRVKTAYDKAADPEAIGTGGSTADKFGSGNPQPLR
tara:strand:- start:717 stop:1274 length:558 start_codon:yes stop_codon:yes gene_type:complete